MKKTSLVILAAGIGSRYGGGIKQMDPIGPNGEIMMDYSIHDAIEAGFDKVVFIIRKDLDEDFRAIIGDRISKKIEVAYAYQELSDLPEGFSVPEGRKKPWGTGQALLAAKDVINEPFAVINADDYYGKKGFALLHDILVNEDKVKPVPVSMCAFVLKNTLSDNGGVTRGILSTDEAGNLTGISETKNIIKTPEGAAVSKDGKLEILPDDALVSMNMWGYTPEIMPLLEREFVTFLGNGEGDPLTKEFLLPIVSDKLLASDEISIKVVRSDDVWFGVTYKEDKEAVKASIADLIDKGVYTSPLA